MLKQIRAHAKYLGIPLLGDEVYGGTKNMALSLLQPKNESSFHGKILQLISGLERPCLHALTLGYINRTLLSLICSFFNFQHKFLYMMKAN